jgi:hypothetical protein
MFSIHGAEYRHCDGLSRRHFLTAGALGVGGLTLADLLRAEQTAGIRASQKAVINVHLDGGPPQMDMIDLKPDAPREIRGEFQSIATKLPGFRICELLPKIAGIADKFAFIRTLVGSAGAHDAFQCQSGFGKNDLRSIGGRPALGSVIAKLGNSASDPAPPYVDLMQGRPFVRNSARSGFLGPAYGPFRPDISKLFSRPLEDAMKKELAALGQDHHTSLALNKGLSAERLNDRVRLLSALDHIKSEVDSSGQMDALDRFTQQAVGILTSGRFAAAMDISRESPRIRERYTLANANDQDRFVTADASSATKKFLLARRLVEAGVRCVSISLGDFDTHEKNFPRMRHALPILDQGLWALVTDLEERGRLDDVSIVVWGEFGRTPRIDPKSGGRHHWPNVGIAILAGGGMRVGQVIGETDKHAATPVSRPVHFKDVFATLYHNLGIDPRRTTITDHSGRPHYLLDGGEALPELV